MEFRERLKALRKEIGMTQIELGEKLNYGSTAIANYEQAETSLLFLI